MWHAIITFGNTSDVNSGLPRVAFQGTLGAFSELAIRKHWPDGAQVVPRQTFIEAVQCVVLQQADFAVIPIENAVVGPVHVALSALNDVDAQLQRGPEITLPVRLCLMACAGASINSVREVLSHPVALAQCGKFFAKHAWMTPVVHVDTGSAACSIAQAAELHRGAIASESAAALYGLHIIASNIADLESNWTRFVVVSAR